MKNVWGDALGGIPLVERFALRVNMGGKMLKLISLVLFTKTSEAVVR
jgi:hypothetical protein